MTPKNVLSRIGKTPLVVRLLVAIALGVVVGRAFGPRAELLGELGILVIRLLKALATPLVFFAIVDSFCRAQIPAKKGVILLAICVVNATVAGTLAIVLTGLVQPGRYTNPEALERTLGGVAKGKASTTHMDLLSGLKELIPESIPEPFMKNAVLAVVLLAVATGLALRVMRARGGGEMLAKLASEAFELLTIVLHAVIGVVPIAVFGVVAKVVGTVGFGVFVSLGALVGTVTAGLAIHVFVYYALVVLLVARRSPIAFFRAARFPLGTAFGTGSSMATLPVTLTTLEKDLKVGHDSARLAACVGTNFNNDGIMLYEVVAALFIAQMNAITLGTGDKIQLAATSALAAAGIAGVPEAGLITLSLVLSSVGLPLASLPMLLTVDWLLGRFRAMTNVTSDLLVATLLDRLGGSSQDGSPRTDGDTTGR